MKTANSKVVFTLPSCLEVATQAAKAIGLSRDRIILLEGIVEGTRNLNDLIESGRHTKEAAVWQIPAGKSNQDVCGYQCCHPKRCITC